MATGLITKSSVDAVKPAATDQYLWDEKIAGFGFKVTPSGGRIYLYQYRLGGRDGKTQRVTIGKHGAFTPDQARGIAKSFAADVVQGKDPAAEKRARNDKRASDRDLAFDAYCAVYLKNRVKAENLASYGNIEMVFRLHAIPVLKAKPLPAITRRDVIAVIDRIPATSPALRRSTYAMLHKLFNWAKSRDDIGANPMDGMDAPPPAAGRDRVLSDGELTLALQAIDKMDALFGPFYQLLFASGQRREEVAGLFWSELDRTKALWTLPKERAKNGEANIVPLNRPAMAALDRAAVVIAVGEAVAALEMAAAKAGKKVKPADQETAAKAAEERAIAETRTGARKWPVRGLVFTGTGKSPISGFSRAKARLDAEMLKLARKAAEEGGDDPEAVELVPWRLHDARRTLATGLQRLGVRFEVTEAILNHTSGARAGVAGIYQRHGWGPEKRAALDAWADHCGRLLNPAAETDNVVALRAAESSPG